VASYQQNRIVFGTQLLGFEHEGSQSSEAIAAGERRRQCQLDVFIDVSGDLEGALEIERKLIFGPCYADERPIIGQLSPQTYNPPPRHADLVGELPSLNGGMNGRACGHDFGGWDLLLGRWHVS
jgi:hypothetical protein